MRREGAAGRRRHLHVFMTVLLVWEYVHYSIKFEFFQSFFDCVEKKGSFLGCSRKPHRIDVVKVAKMRAFFSTRNDREKSGERLTRNGKSDIRAPLKIRRTKSRRNVFRHVSQNSFALRQHIHYARGIFAAKGGGHHDEKSSRRRACSDTSARRICRDAPQYKKRGAIFSQDSITLFPI